MIQNFGLIIGAMRCGTTAMFYTLGQHPQVCLSSVREPTFFTNPTEFRNGMEYYERLYDWDPEQHRIAVDKSTHNTKYPRLSGAASRMRLVDRHFKFVYMVRNPIEMIESARLHNLARLPEKFAGSKEDIVRTAMYGTQIEQYLDHFDPSTVLVVSLSEFRAEHARAVRRVCQHFGIREIDLDPVRPVNTSKKNRETIGSDRRHILSQREREEVWDLLAPDMRRFRRLTGFDIRVWGF